MRATKGPGHEGKASEHSDRTAPPCPSARPATHSRTAYGGAASCGGVPRAGHTAGQV